MKKFVSLLMLSMVLILAACGSDTKEVTPKKVDSVSSESKGDKTEEKVEDEGEKKELNQEVADTENVKATLISFEKIVDKAWDEEKYIVRFEVENKRTSNIGVQAREVSADGKMVNESMLSMSTDISAGKKADADLTIQNYEGDLPDINDNFEMILYVFDENYEAIEEIKVVVDMK